MVVVEGRGGGRAGIAVRGAARRIVSRGNERVTRLRGSFRSSRARDRSALPDVCDRVVYAASALHVVRDHRRECAQFLREPRGLYGFGIGLVYRDDQYERR